jgi:hypothetical protein
LDIGILENISNREFRIASQRGAGGVIPTTPKDAYAFTPSRVGLCVKLVQAAQVIEPQSSFSPFPLKAIDADRPHPFFKPYTRLSSVKPGFIEFGNLPGRRELPGTLTKVYCHNYPLLWPHSTRVMTKSSGR